MRDNTKQLGRIGVLPVTSLMANWQLINKRDKVRGGGEGVQARGGLQAISNGFPKTTIINTITWAYQLNLHICLQDYMYMYNRSIVFIV